MTMTTSHRGPEHILAQIVQDFTQFMHRAGLSRPQIRALLYIYHAGECRITEISALNDSSVPAASQLVKRLVQQGLVHRTEDPGNRRVRKVRLTEKSLKLVRRGVRSNRFLKERMAALTPRQRKTVHTAFGYLAQAGQQIQSSHKQEMKHDAAHT